jgi:two-component system, NarL family, nitrate/nitrite response regulator NarL
MTQKNDVRRPDAGEPLRVWVIADDPVVKSAIETKIFGHRGRPPGIQSSPTEAAAHVAILDLGPATAPGAPPKLDLLTRVDRMKLPVVVLVDNGAHARAAAARGARGVVRRLAEPERVEAALNAVSAGLTVLDFALAPSQAEGEGVQPLTPREREVLELVATGASNRRIAKRLGISEHTAKFHVNGILVKLGAGTRTEAVTIAARRGLLML